jgi:HTH-type transcriptional regulator/antitoxin HigA
MSTVVKGTRRVGAPDSYFALVRKYPLRVVQNQQDYDAASAMLDRLVLRDDLDEGEEQYLAALEVLITDYDEKHLPDMPDTRTPLQRLTALLQSSGTSQADFQAILGVSQSMASMILGGRRELSKKVIAKLSRHFKLDPGYLL